MTSVKPFFKRACLIILFALVGPSMCVAHASGISFESTSGDFIMDLGYDPATFVTEEYTVFDFSLFTGEDKKPVEALDHVWVRITNEQSGIVLATGIRKASLGPTTLLVTLPRAGNYIIATSYRSGAGEELASTEFSFMVQSSSWLKQQGAFVTIVSIIVLMFCSVGIGLYLYTSGLYYKKRASPGGVY